MKQGRRIFRSVLSIMVLVLLALATYWLVNYTTHNVHTVIPAKVYRSAQLTPEALSQTIARYHIRSIINLRGSQPSQAWYPAEVAVTQRYGITRVDLPFNAHKLPSVAQLAQLTENLTDLPRPILLHCRQGADRTGMAAAIALLLLTQPTQSQLWQQVSWYYNVLSPSSVGYQLMKNYLPWCDARHCQLGRESWLEWLASHPVLRPSRGVAAWPVG